MEDYEETYEEFWKDIIENTDGSLNMDQLKRELHDYRMMLDAVPKVYCHVTGGIVSKPLTDPNVVTSLADEHYGELYDETFREHFRYLVNCTRISFA